MRHEPELRVGHDFAPGIAVAFGWVTRPDTFADGAPFWNSEHTIGLIFAGEEFSGNERARAGRPHDDSKLAGGASGIIELYEEVGASCFAKLNGWFSGLLIDLRESKAILFNDRYGLGRLYYYDGPEGFFFSSEAKSLLAVLPKLREINEQSLAEFYSIGCALQNRTLYRDIALLPGASRWTFHAGGRIEREQYFESRIWEEQSLLEPEAYLEQLQEVFGRVAPRYLRGPQLAALSLTGGLDSRMLLAWAGARPGSLPCYTFGGPYRDCHDLRIARRLAAASGQPHTTIPIGDDFFPRFPDLAEQSVYLSDGTMDVSGAVELYANRRAREIAPVRLTGNYGSEILRSNVAFRPGALDRTIFTPEFSKLLDEAAVTYRAEAAGHRLSFIAFKQVPWHHYGRLSIEQSQLTPRSPFLDNELVALAYRAPHALATSPRPALEVIAKGNPGLNVVPTDRALSLRPTRLLGRLAHSWQEFTAKAEYAFDYGMPQRLVKIDHLLSGLHLERLFLGRHKFYHLRIWYKKRLKDYLEMVAEAADAEPACYRPGAGHQLIHSHLSGRGNHTLEISKLLTVGMVQRLLLKSSWAV